MADRRAVLERHQPLPQRIVRRRHEGQAVLLLGAGGAGGWEGRFGRQQGKQQGLGSAGEGRLRPSAGWAGPPPLIDLRIAYHGGSARSRALPLPPVDRVGFEAPGSLLSVGVQAVSAVNSQGLRSRRPSGAQAASSLHWAASLSLMARRQHARRRPRRGIAAAAVCRYSQLATEPSQPPPITELADGGSAGPCGLSDGARQHG